MGPKQMPLGLFGEQAGTSTLIWPTQSHGDRGADGRILGHLHKVPPLTTPPNTNKGPAAVMQAIDKWAAYQD